MNGPRNRLAEPAKDYKIGLWGPPASGKTTFLAALKVASLRSAEHWIMTGADDESEKFLIDSVRELVRERVFPDFTHSMTEFVFRFVGNPPARRGGWLRSRTMGPPDRVAFDLTVLDVPGRLYGYGGVPGGRSAPGFDTSGIASVAYPDDDRPASSPAEREDDDERLLRHLEDCDGIVFLFDPVGKDEDNSFEHFHRILEKLARRYFAQDHFGKAHLPQQMSVCISKFDQSDVYSFAKRYGFTLQDAEPPHLPRVPNDQASEFFDVLCRKNPHTNADLVNSLITRYFKDVRFYATSAIGFYVADGQRFRPYDGPNLVPNGSSWGIKGQVFPINVLEPVIALHERLRTKAR